MRPWVGGRGEVTCPRSHSWRVIKPGFRPSCSQRCTYSVHILWEEEHTMWATCTALNSKAMLVAIVGFLPVKELNDFRKTCAHAHTHPFKQLFLRGSVPADGPPPTQSYSSAALGRFQINCQTLPASPLMKNQPSAPTLRNAEISRSVSAFPLPKSPAR